MEPTPPTGHTPAFPILPVTNRRNLIIGIAAVVVVIACCSCGLINAVNGNASSGSSSSAAASHVVATHTPAPTATDAPPTATPSPADVFQHLAAVNCNEFSAGGKDPKAVWSPASGTVTVTTTVGEAWDAKGATVEVESIVFDCFKGYYTSPHASAVKDVKVVVNGPLTDAYGNTSTGLYGDAELSRVTAAPFNWKGLDYQTAWDNNIYDDQFMRSN